MQGMPQNLTAAREAFEKGAALNNSDSLYNLGTMHFSGVGVAINQTLGEPPSLTAIITYCKVVDGTDEIYAQCT